MRQCQWQNRCHLHASKGEKLPTAIQPGPGHTIYQANWIDAEGKRRRKNFTSAPLARRWEHRMRIEKLGDQLRRAAELSLHHTHGKKPAVRQLLEAEFKRILAAIA